MKISNVKEVKLEVVRLLGRIEAVEESAININRFTLDAKFMATTSSKETGALKRASMDLTRALAKMRNDIW